MSDLEIGELISCRKMLLDGKIKKLKIDFQHKKSNAKCIGVDNGKQFSVFIRQSLEFFEDFSVGLLYYPKDGSPTLNLLRLNGRHFANRHIEHHRVNHIHKLTSADIANGVLQPKKVEKAESYASFEEAIRLFGSLVSIDKWEASLTEIWSDLFIQRSLFDDDSRAN